MWTVTSDFCTGGGISACPVPEDGCALLHCEGEGSAGTTGAQKDSHSSMFDGSQKVSEFK